jgi:hypothetical protein
VSVKVRVKGRGDEETFPEGLAMIAAPGLRRGTAAAATGK